MLTDRSDAPTTSRSTLTWLLIAAVVLVIISPPAGFVAALLVAIVTAVRSDLRRDLVWSSLVASVTIVLAVIALLKIGDIFG